MAAYEFTTLTTVPGLIRYKGAKIQVIWPTDLTRNQNKAIKFALKLLDLPGIIEGAKDGKGRGKQVIAGK